MSAAASQPGASAARAAPAKALAPVPPALDPPLGHRRQHHAVCGSTNDEAARLGRAGAPHGTLVTAAAQTAGRGRLGRAWHSPPGESLYLSLLLRPALPPLRAPLLTLAAGAALAQTVEAWLQRAPGEADRAKLPRPELKWPNDLLLRGSAGPARKVAGILTELVCRGGVIDFLVMGIGVNLNSLRFPEELAERATSLRLALGGGGGAAPLVDGEALLAELLRRLDDLYRRFLRDGAAPVLAAFRAHAAFLDRGEALTVRSGEERVVGIAQGLAEDGALLLRDEAGVTRRIVAGELT